MDRIPEDVLVLIFYALGPVVFPKNDPINRPQDIPILNVCRSWRRTALSMERLWSFIDLRGPKFPSPDTMRQFLLLSGESLLAIAIHNTKTMDTANPDVMQSALEVLEVLRTRLHRCCSLLLSLSWRYHLSIADILISSVNLTDLILHGKFNDRRTNPTFKLTIVLPRLRAFQFASGMLDSSDQLTLAAPCLRRLKILSIAVSDRKSINRLLVSVAETVTHLDFMDIGPVLLVDAINVDGLPPINLPAIQVVTIQRRKKSPNDTDPRWLEYPAYIVNHITRPFNLFFRGIDLLNFMKTVRSKTAQQLEITLWTAPPLEDTKIEGAPGLQDEHTIHQFFVNLPALERLHIEGYDSEFTEFIRNIFEKTRPETPEVQ